MTSGFVIAISDTAGDNGFKDGNNSGNDYVYDANGNMIEDKNKGIVNIEYNHLDLPKRIIFDEGNEHGSHQIKYTYEATGTKLSKEVITYTGTNGRTHAITHYENGFITKESKNYTYDESYNGNEGSWIGNEIDHGIKFISHPEGYIEPNNQGGYDYVFQYKDHLGNIRLSYSDKNNDGQITASTEIIEENNYYPFGLKHKGYNNVITSTNPALNYKYNQGTSGKNFQGKEGKTFKVEQQLDLGLNLDMTKFRTYDYTLGRFTSVDRLADANPQESWTPYQYAYNNPIRYNDPYGDCPQCIWGGIIGAAVDYGLQVTGNIVEGKDLGEALVDIDRTSILVSAGAGALSGGISSLSKLQKAGKLVKTAVDVATDTGVSVSSQTIKHGDVSLKKTLIDVTAGQTVGKVAGKKTRKKVANSAKGKRLKTKVNEQKNIARGKSNRTPKSKANVKKAQAKLDNYVETRAAASSTTASGATSTLVEKGEKRVNEKNN